MSPPKRPIFEHLQSGKDTSQNLEIKMALKVGPRGGGGHSHLEMVGGVRPRKI